MIQLEKLDAGYGRIHVLHGISLHVEAGELVAVLGANGTGKTTLLKTLAGILKPRGGQILFDGKPINALPSWERAALGISLIPEGGRVFPDLTIAENLRLGTFNRPRSGDIQALEARVFDLFPDFKGRESHKAKTLSGGLRQMLAIGRALMASPRLLLVDEISMGLMPILVNSVFQTLQKLNEEGMTILIVEQNARKTLEIIQRGYVIERGRLTVHGTAEELRREEAIRRAYLGG